MKKDNELTNDEKNKRRFYLVLPLLVMPFITILFVLLGGGRGHGKGKGLTEQVPGINKQLPGAQVDGKVMDKLESYDQVKQTDSEDHLGLNGFQTRTDLAFQSGFDSLALTNDEPSRRPVTFNNYAAENAYAADAKSEEIQQKLLELNRSLKEQEKQSSLQEVEKSPPPIVSPDTEIRQMEKLVQSLGEASPENQDGGEDPQMAQLGGMLNTILDIQHPDRVAQRLKQLSSANRGRIYAVKSEEEQIPVTGLWPDTVNAVRPMGTGFYSIQKSIDENLNISSSGIEAVVYQDQTVVNGTVVKLQLLQPVYINGIRIADNQFIYGVAKLAGERLEIQISSFRYEDHLLPIDLSAFDYDGLSGICIPGSLSRDVAKESSDQAIQGLGLASLDPSLGAQVAGAGIEAAKNLLSKKVKLVKVHLKAGYKVLLRDNKDKGGDL